MDIRRLCPHCFCETAAGNYCTTCGHRKADAKQDPFALPMFSLLTNRYLLGEILGSGGFGITYLALDCQSGIRKAIKEYYPRECAARAADGKGVLSKEDKRRVFNVGLQKFSEEASILRSIGGINSVVRVDDYFAENNTAYMVMEYVDGTPLRNICKEQGGQVSFMQANAEFIALAYTLDEIHLNNLLHRDVSPDNIMMLPDGSIKLIDFGAARHVVRDSGKSLTIVLKPGFAPLEQYSKSGVQGPWTDIYGLACSMYWYLTGVKVPDAPSRQAGRIVEPLYRLRPDIPRGFSKIIEKAMAVDYRKRYQSVSEMLTDIDDVTGVITEAHLAAPRSGPAGMGKASAGKRHMEKPAAGVPRAVREMIFAQMVGGPLDGYLFPFNPDDSLTVGRSSQSCAAVIPANTVSREHCRLVFDRQRRLVTVIDVSSTGTFFPSGARFPHNTPIAVREGEMFYLSDPLYTLRVICIKDASAGV